MKNYILLVIIPLLSYACKDPKVVTGQDMTKGNKTTSKSQDIEVNLNLIFEDVLSNKNISIVTTTREASVIKNYMIEGNNLQEKVKFKEPGMYRIRFDKSDVPLVISGDEEGVVLQIYNKPNNLNYDAFGSSENINFKTYLDLFSPGKKFDNQEKIAFLDSISPSYVGSQIYTFEIANNNQLFANEFSTIKAKYDGLAYASNLMKSIDYIQEDPVAIGAKVPSFSLPSIKGGNIGPVDFKGKYLLLDFWASWCGPCRKEVPNVRKAYDKYRKDGFDVLAVSTDQTDNPWKKAVGKLEMDWPQVRDVTGEVSNIFKIQYIPTVYLIDPKGIIIAEDVRGEKLEILLEEIFGY